MGMSPIGDVLVNGERRVAADAAVRLDDVALLRGYGCFETIRSYGGVPFRLGEHLDRLGRSAAALRIPLPARSHLEAWCHDRAAAGDVAVRVVVTGGTDMDDLGRDAVVIVFAHAMAPRPESVRLIEVTAPWHPAGRPTELAGVKALSYAPHMAALLRAAAAGGDDALLLGVDQTVLELTTSSVAWVIDGTVETPSLDLGILRSVTRGAMIEVAGALDIAVAEGMYPSSRIRGANEVFVMSTTREIAPATAVNGHQFVPGPVTAALQAGLGELVMREIGAGSRRG